MMRDHTPQYRLAKERDYIGMEARSFFGDLRSMLMFLPDAMGGLHPETRAILKKIEADTEKHDHRNFHTYAEEARQLAWKCMKTSYENQTAWLLTFTNWLSFAFRIDAKKPDKYDAGLRPGK